MNVRLLTDYNLVFLSLTGGCTGSSESTFVKMQHCWKSHVVAHMCLFSKRGYCKLSTTSNPPALQIAVAHDVYAQVKMSCDM